jgi:hypothetical protein
MGKYPTTYSQQKVGTRKGESSEKMSGIKIVDPTLRKTFLRRLKRKGGYARRVNATPTPRAKAAAAETNCDATLKSAPALTPASAAADGSGFSAIR